MKEGGGELYIYTTWSSDIAWAIYRLYTTCRVAV
jgi:hypothetical protein